MGTYSGVNPNGIQVTSASQIPVTITRTGYVGDYGQIAAVRVNSGIVGDVSNFGVVKTTSTFANHERANFHAGIWLFGGGSVLNGATGLIDVTGTGIQVTGSSTTATITNLGTVEANNPLGGFYSVNGPLGVGASFGAGVLTNGSTASHKALIEGNGNGIDVAGGTIKNFAIIEAAPNKQQYGYYGAGGSADGRGIKTDYESVSIIINYHGGAIEGHLTGIANGAGASVVNSGVITAPQGVGITCTGGYIDNTRTGVISGLSTGIACYNSVNGASGGTVVNAGTIEATGSSGLGVLLQVGGSTLTNSGTISGSGGVAVQFQGLGGRGLSGYNHLVIAPTAVFLGGVIATGSDVLELGKGSGTATFTGFGTQFSGFGSVIVDPGATWSVALKASAFAGVTITGNASTVRPLTITSAGTADLSGVSGFPIITLDPSGADSVSLTDGNFAGTKGGITINGGHAGNTVDASAVSVTSHRVTFVGGSGIDVFTGGAGADVFEFTATGLSGDTVAGGGGSDRLSLTSSGTVSMSGVSGIETVMLADTHANTLTLTNANFTGVTGTAIRVVGGSAGNTLDASAVTGTNRVTFVGGAGADKFVTGARTAMTGGDGADQFVFSGTGTNSITDFAASDTNRVLLRDSGFNLGPVNEGKGTATAKHLDITAFVANATGTFTKANQRFALNTTTGTLYYDADGSGPGSARVAVVTFQDHASADFHLAAGGSGNLFYVA